MNPHPPPPYRQPHHRLAPWLLPILCGSLLIAARTTIGAPSQDPTNHPLGHWRLFLSAHQRAELDAQRLAVPSQDTAPAAEQEVTTDAPKPTIEAKLATRPTLSPPPPQFQPTPATPPQPKLILQGYALHGDARHSVWLASQTQTPSQLQELQILRIQPTTASVYLRSHNTDVLAVPVGAQFQLNGRRIADLLPTGAIQRHTPPNALQKSSTKGNSKKGSSKKRTFRAVPRRTTPAQHGK